MLPMSSESRTPSSQPSLLMVSAVAYIPTVLLLIVQVTVSAHKPKSLEFAMQSCSSGRNSRDARQSTSPGGPLEFRSISPLGESTMASWRQSGLDKALSMRENSSQRRGLSVYEMDDDCEADKHVRMHLYSYRHFTPDAMAAISAVSFLVSIL